MINISAQKILDLFCFVFLPGQPSFDIPYKGKTETIGNSQSKWGAYDIGNGITIV